MGSDAEVALGVIQAVEERDGAKLFELYQEDVQLHDAPSLPYGGARFESPVIGLYEVRDGKLARAQMFHYDTAAINAFLERAREASASKAA